MQFNDTTSRTGLLQDCEDLLGLGALAITGNTTLLQTFTRNINSWYHKVVTMLLSSQDDWDFDDSNKTDYPIATTPLVAGQRDYSFSTTLKLLKIKRADITYDGVNYYPLLKFDSSMAGYGLGNDTQTDARFSKTEPYADYKANSIWIYPLPSASDVSAGGKIRIEFYREITEFTTSSTTSEPGFDEPFHRILSIGAAFDYAMAKQLPQKKDLWTLLQDYEARLKQYYSKRSDDQSGVVMGAYINYK